MNMTAKMLDFREGVRDTRRVIFYGRWSDPSQARGHSLKRQKGDLLLNYIDTNQLDPDFEVVIDDGVSAHDGANRLKGNLGKIIARAKAGELKGYHIIFESADRLTREGPVVAALLLSILTDEGDCAMHVLRQNAGVTVKSCEELGFFLPFMLSASAAKADSDEKQIKVLEALDDMREAAQNGEKVNNRLPGWYESVYDTKTAERVDRKLRKEQVKTVKRAFELGLKNMGGTTIAQVLNAEGHESFGVNINHRKNKRITKWTQATVNRLLRNRAVIGYYQQYRIIPNRKKGERKDVEKVGKEIKGYYDEIISPAVFRAVNRLIDKRKDKGVPKNTSASNRNVLNGMLKCGHCGGSMFLQYRKHRGGKTNARCWNNAYGSCEHNCNYRFDSIVEGVIEMVNKVDLDGGDRGGEAEKLEAKLANLRDATARLMEDKAVYEEARPTKSITAKINKLDDQIEAADGEEQELLDAIARTRTVAPTAHRKALLRRTAKLIDVSNMKAPTEMIVARAQVRTLLLDMVARIECVDPALKPQPEIDDRHIQVTVIGQEHRRHVLNRAGQWVDSFTLGTAPGSSRGRSAAQKTGSRTPRPRA